MGVLRAKLLAQADSSNSKRRERDRRQQVGSGMRGDKRRTVAVQRDRVTDHVTGKSISFKDFSRGRLSGLVD